MKTFLEKAATGNSLQENLLKDYALILIRKYSPIFAKRFESQSINGGKYKPVEEVEEIRLLLVQIMAVLVRILEEGKDAIEQEVDIANLDLSSVCQSISKSALVDAYPELKRESCYLIKTMCIVFPRCIRMHAETLLTPLIGTSIPRRRDDQIGDVHEHGFESMEIQFSSQNLSTSTNSLLRHRHAKTRSLALDTVAAILSCDSCRSEQKEQQLNGRTVDRIILQVLPNVEAVGPFDKSASVRSALVKLVCSLLAMIPHPQGRTLSCSVDFERDVNGALSRLLILHLMCVSDESPHVQEVAKQEFSKLTGSSIGKLDNACDALQLLQAFASQIIEHLVYFIGQGTSIEQKKRYLEALRSIINCLNDCSAPSPVRREHIASIVSLLCDSISSNEKIIFQSTTKCAIALGYNPRARKDAMCIALEAMSDNADDSTIDAITITQAISRKASLLMSTSQHCTALVQFVSGLLKSITISPHNKCLNDEEWAEIDTVMSTVIGQKVIDFIHASQDAAFALIDLLCVILRLIKTSHHVDQVLTLDCIVQKSLFCCMHLIGCNADFNVSIPAKELLTSLDSESFFSVSKGSTLDNHFHRVLNLVLSGLNGSENDCWEYGDPSMFAFDALLRNALASTIGDNFDKVGSILNSHLCGEVGSLVEKGNEYFQKRLFFMALLESVVSKETVSKQHLHHFVEKLVRNAIIPNLVWQSGALASSLRKVTAAVLFSLVCGGGLSDVALFKCAPVLLPVLKSTISDDDSSTRELATATLAKVFEMIPGLLGEEAVHQIYPDLMKGLDDSNERVRFASCDALLYFLTSASSKNYKGTAIEYMVENLFLHLDDPNPDFREKVYDVLTTAISVDSNTVARNAKTSLSSHHIKDLCLKLLQAAENAQKHD